MTDRRELDALLDKAIRAGATVTLTRDFEGCYTTFLVRGLKGIGPYPMGPLSFAERMRSYFAKNQTQGVN